MGFTTETSFKTTKINSNVTYIVKTKLANLSCTASSGITTNVKGEPEKTSSLLTYELNGNLKDTATVGNSYTDAGIKVFSDGIDVTSKAKITVSCAELGTSGKAQKETYTFTKAGTYTLKYTISYNGSTETATRTITVSDSSSGTGGNSGNETDQTTNTN